MKWLSQRRKVEALSLKASLLSIQSHALKQELHHRTIEQLRKPATLIVAFAAGAMWIATPADKRDGRIKRLLKFASTSSYIFRVLGIPLPMRSLFG